MLAQELEYFEELLVQSERGEGFQGVKFVFSGFAAKTAVVNLSLGLEESRNLKGYLGVRGYKDGDPQEALLIADERGRIRLVAVYGHDKMSHPKDDYLQILQADETDMNIKVGVDNHLYEDRNGEGVIASLALPFPQTGFDGGAVIISKIGEDLVIQVHNAEQLS